MAELRRTLLGMLAAGALIAGLRAVLTEPPQVDVDTQTLLVEQALAAGWHRTDPIVRTRLIENLRFAGRDGSDAELLREALDLGMARTDPVVRLHLAGRARRVLESVPDPSQQQLADWLAAHPERFRRPDVYVLEVRPVDRPVAGLPGRMAGTVAQLEGRLGASLGPLDEGGQARLATPWGAVEVHAERRIPGEVPPLDAIRSEVRQDWQQAQREQVVEERLVALRREVAR